MAAKEKYVLCAGLPRSGSTMLMNILAQNPRFHCTASSGLVEVMMMIKNRWNQVEPHRAIPTPEESEATKIRVIRAMFEAYHETERPIVVDKSRGWLSELEMLRRIRGHAPLKVLVPVRDLREVLCSFEIVYRRSKDAFQVPQEGRAYFQFLTLEGRFKHLNLDEEPVGAAYNRIRDAVARGFRDHMHFVDFDRVLANPDEELEMIYDFLDEQRFTHDFTDIRLLTPENDAVYVWRDLHKIRSRISAPPRRWPGMSCHLSPQARDAIEQVCMFWKDWL